MIKITIIMVTKIIMMMLAVMRKIDEDYDSDCADGGLWLVSIVLFLTVKSTCELVW